MKPPASIRLRLLGRLALACGNEETPIRLSTRKAGALIAYLAMSPEQTASREELAALLWGDTSDQQARQSLRQSLVLLRKELGSPDYFIADAAVVRLQPNLWSVDARAFEELSKSSDPDELARAAGLFGGEFLTGLNLDEEGFDEWVGAQRQRMQLAAARLCETYAARPELVSDGQLAIAAAESLMALDPLREDWHRLALTLYARYRGRNEALAQAELFAATLQRELGVAPEKATRALVEAIRACATAEPDAIAMIAPHAPNAVPKLPVSVARAQPLLLHRRGMAAALAGVVALAAIGLAGYLFLPRAGDRAASSPGVSVPAPEQLQAQRDTRSDRQSDPHSAPHSAPHSDPHSDPWASPGSPPPAADRRPGNRDGIVAIAVLPFVVQGQGSESSLTAADVLTDDLTYVLSRCAELRVIAYQTTRQYRDQPHDDHSVAAELQVHYLLKGSVDAEGDTLRVSVALIDAKSGRNAWTASFERIGPNRNTIQDEILISVGRELQIEVTRHEAEPTTESPTVHALIFKGYAAIADSGVEGLPALKRAEANFSKALELDPDNARAQAGLGIYHNRMAVQLFAADQAPHLAKAEALLRSAIERQPANSQAQKEMGLFQIASGHGNLARAFFERAIALNPSEAAAYAQLGRTMVSEGRAAEGLERILYAMRLSPRDYGMANFLSFAGGAELELEHYEKAIAYLDRSLVLHPTQPRTRLVQISAYAMAGRLDEARSLLAELQKKLPHLSGEKLIVRFFGPDRETTRRQLREGLRLALAPATDRTLDPTLDPWASPPSDHAARIPTGIIPIAVLPFTSVGDVGGATQLIADMMTDDLINILSRASAVRVVSRQTTNRYREQPIDIAAIGAELQVRYVLEGSARAQDGVLRVNVQLLDTTTRLPVWSGRVEREGADRYAVRDEIVMRIARELQIEIVPIEGERRSADQTADASAYLGWAAMQEAFSRTSLDDYKRAEAHFRTALERDPQHVAAFVGMGAYHVNVAVQRLDSDTKLHFEKAREILGQALQRNPRNASALFQLGILEQGSGKIKDGLALFEKVVELNPSNPGSHAHIGHALARTGQPEKGIEHIRYAMRLSPKDPSLAIWHEFLGNAQLELGRYPDAIESFRNATVLAPRYPRPWAGLAAAHALAGHSNGVEANLDRLRALEPGVDAAGLIERLGRRKGSRLNQGLRLALAPPADPWQPPRPPSQPAADTQRADAKRLVPLLVLPFTAVGETAGATQPLADLVTDDLTNLLSRVASLRVISRRTALAFKGQPVDVAALGSELQVRYVLEGSMRMHDGTLRVNLELIDPATRLPAWTSRIEHVGTDRNRVVDEIVLRLARELQFEIITIEAERRSNDSDSDALVARGWASLYDITPKGYRQAESYFRQALERDPDSLPARIGMGAYHARIGALALDSEPLVHRAKAAEILRDAIRRDPQSSAAHFYLGLALKLAPTFEESIEHMERAIALNPSFPAAYVHIGHSLAQIGRAAEGLEHIKYGLRLSPRDTTLGVFLDMAGDVELTLGRFDAAIEDFRRSAALKPAYPRPWAGLAAAYALTGRTEEARGHAEKLKSLLPGLTADQLIEQFGRNPNSPQYQGLRIALASSLAATVPTR